MGKYSSGTLDDFDVLARMERRSRRAIESASEPSGSQVFATTPKFKQFDADLVDVRNRADQALALAQEAKDSAEGAMEKADASAAAADAAKSAAAEAKELAELAHETAMKAQKDASEAIEAAKAASGYRQGVVVAMAADRPPDGSAWKRRCAMQVPMTDTTVYLYERIQDGEN